MGVTIITQRLYAKSKQGCMALFDSPPPIDHPTESVNDKEKSVLSVRLFRGWKVEEKTFLSLDDVKVTSARFIVPSQTFAMAGITSVKNSEQRPNRVYPVWCGIFGIVALIADAYVVGVALLALAAIWWIGQKPQFHVVLATAGGEMTALSSPDRSHISSVVKALNDSIVARG